MSQPPPIYEPPSASPPLRKEPLGIGIQIALGLATSLVLLAICTVFGIFGRKFESLSWFVCFAVLWVLTYIAIRRKWYWLVGTAFAVLLAGWYVAKWTLRV